MVKKDKYWNLNYKYRTTKEWAEMPVDWCNEAKFKNVDSYFFRYDNFVSNESNSIALRSVFGRKSLSQIEKEIDWWFSRCIGVYSETNIK